MVCYECNEFMILFPGATMHLQDDRYFHGYPYNCYVNYMNRTRSQMANEKRYVEVNGTYPAKFSRGTTNYQVYQIMRADKPFVLYIPRFDFRAGTDSGLPLNINFIVRPGTDRTRSEIQADIIEMRRKLSQLEDELQLKVFPNE